MTDSDTYVYEVNPVNYFNLGEEERGAVLARFASGLQQLSSTAVFHIRLDKMSVVVGNEIYEVKYRRYFVEGPVLLDGFLAAIGMQGRYVRVLELPQYNVVANLPKYAVLDTGDLVKAYTVTGLSPELETAFLAANMGESSILEKTDTVRLRIEPIDRNKSKGLMRLHADILQAKLDLTERSGGMDRELAQQTAMAEEAAQQVISGSQKLFKLSCTMTVKGRNFDELKKNVNSFKDMIMGVVTELDSPKGIQRYMVTGTGPQTLRGATLVMPTDSILSFFPFAGLEIIEHEGLFFGVNLQTQGPIIYNPYTKGNPHIVVIGKTGFGKSMSLKSWVSRMASTYPDLAFMVFDSIKESEYAKGADGSYEHSFAGLTGAKVISFDPSHSMGLDPLALFNKKQASSLIAKMAHLREEERSLRAELAKVVQSDTTRTIQDLYRAQLSPELRLRLDANLKPVNFMFEGQPQDPYTRTIFTFDGLPEDAEIRGAAVILASALAMKALKTLPISQKKMLLIDEAWTFLATDDRGELYFSEAMDIVGEMARTGRHYNIALVLATQYGKDLMSGQGKTVLESCATKVLIHQDPAGQGGGSDLAQQIFSLSDQERTFIERADRGFGIIFTEQGRVPFYNRLTDMERSYFTTNPDEIAEIRARQAENPEPQEQEVTAS